MQGYKKVYCDFFGYAEGDYIDDEVTGGTSVDIHHLDTKGLGGSKSKDYIENLVALTRENHEKCHNDPMFNLAVRIIHLKNVIKKLENG